jgi:hypothetical protein
MALLTRLCSDNSQHLSRGEALPNPEGENLGSQRTWLLRFGML